MTFLLGPKTEFPSFDVAFEVSVGTFQIHDTRKVLNVKHCKYLGYSSMVNRAAGLATDDYFRLVS